jgi:hypothetical protein
LVPVYIDESKLITEEQALRSPEADAILALRANLKHEPQHEADLVRQRSVWALSQVRNGRLVEPLIAALQNDDWRVRAYAAWAVAVTKDARALPALFTTARDEHWRVRANTFAALGEITGLDAERAKLFIRGLGDPTWQVLQNRRTTWVCWAEMMPKLRHPRWRRRAHVSARCGDRVAQADELAEAVVPGGEGEVAAEKVAAQSQKR